MSWGWIWLCCSVSFFIICGSMTSPSWCLCGSCAWKLWYFSCIDMYFQRLRGLGVQRLVLPAVSSVLNAWTTSFGFSKMTDSERSEFLNYTFLDFQETVMCQKFLLKNTVVLSSLTGNLSVLLLMKCVYKPYLIITWDLYLTIFGREVWTSWWCQQKQQ